ncbi:hypothetical protein AB1Y20_012718 [Prymnesium parvum]|uniref:Uncharacterized protein n=1 Tax=Prymnesium parvum TaxID=97485 RepID=A0AB34ILG8_PRYPA
MTWRCSRCYQKLRTAGIVKRLRRMLETASTKAVLKPEVQALLDINWRALSLGAQSSPSPLMQIDEVLQAWCWRHACHPRVRRARAAMTLRWKLCGHACPAALPSCART